MHVHLICVCMRALQFHDICFGGAPGVDKLAELEQVFPSLHLKLGGGIELKMGPLNYLFMHSSEAGAYCLGVFDNGAAGTLLGGITFRNMLVQVGSLPTLM